MYKMAFFCMKNDEKCVEEVEEGTSLSRTLIRALLEVLREGKFPPLMREIIQFYLRNVAVFKARVLDNNRITIPKEEVDLLGIRPGGYVAVILTKIEEVGGRG